jgi:hypothetical protein
MNEFESNEDLVAMQLKSLNKLRNDGIRDISDFIAAAGLQNHIDTSGRWITNDFPLVTFIKELCCTYVTLERVSVDGKDIMLLSLLKKYYGIVNADDARNLLVFFASSHA